MSIRVASLLASATEIVCAVGRESSLVGRSHECDHPEGIRRLPILTEAKLDMRLASAAIDARVRALVSEATSVYRVDADALRAVQPDLIVTQMQCEVCAVSVRDVECALESWLGSAPQVVSLGAETLEGLWRDIEAVASAVDAAEAGAQVVADLQSRLRVTATCAAEIATKPTVACIEWIEPLMASGNWMPELVAAAGGDNVFGEVGRHSPLLSWDELVGRDPEVIVLMPCGFDLDRTRVEAPVLLQEPRWQRLRAVRDGRVYLADGNRYFNRSGPRLVDSGEILAEMLHPDVFGAAHLGDAWEVWRG